MQLEVKLQKNRRIDVLRRKQTIENVPAKILRGFDVIKKVRLSFSRPKDNMKEKCYVFSGYKQINKVSLMYFECKHQEDRYG